ncbi:MAG: FtsQ-type POTRA domain-containing protein [Deltaproteobacteria bacterium]|nr:FtsQ-type POTRA domain-containing protein [Deltaproteobacteria bacterium]
MGVAGLRAALRGARQHWRWVLGLTAGLALLAGARDRLWHAGFFRVRVVEVEGAQKVARAELLDLAGVHAGEPLVGVDIAGVARQVQRHPWVAAVQVRRAFPDRLSLRVQERQPVAIVSAQALYYVDSEGVVFTQVGPGHSLDYPVITGLDPAAVAAGSPGVQASLRRALLFLEVATRRGLQAQVSEVTLDRTGGLVVFLQGSPARIHIGTEQFETRLDRLLRVQADLQGRAVTPTVIDLTYADRVVVRLTEAGGRRQRGSGPPSARAEGHGEAR